MKTIRFYIINLAFLLHLSSPGIGQSVGNWTFNNVLTGTGTANNSVSPVSLGTSISLGAFNGGTVYFGEDGWPSGSLDANAYLEFSLTPASGRLISLSTLAMQIRRSTTGTPAGSGPNNWSLRSSLDGYSTDIASGTLTTNSSPATAVTLPVSFLNLPATVGFRLYGYNATITSGGLNRFVYDNITANGVTVLPILIENFQANRLTNDAVKLSWTMNGDDKASSVVIERSNNATDFRTLRNMGPIDNNAQQHNGFVDESGAAGHTNAYYRIKVINEAGTIYYSSIQQVIFSSDNIFTVRTLPTTHGSNLRVNVKADKADNYRFYLYNMNGTQIAATATALTDGSQVVNIGRAPSQSGLYILITERAGTTITSKIWID